MTFAEMKNRLKEIEHRHERVYRLETRSIKKMQQDKGDNVFEFFELLDLQKLFTTDVVNESLPVELRKETVERFSYITKRLACLAFNLKDEVDLLFSENALKNATPEILASLRNEIFPLLLENYNELTEEEKSCLINY